MKNKFLSFENNCQGASCMLFQKWFKIKHMRGAPKNPWNLFIKKLLLYFETSVTLTFSPFDAIHLSTHSFHCSEQFLNLSILMPFSAFATFYFTSPTSSKHVLLRTFFIQGNKKSSSGMRSSE